MKAKTLLDFVQELKTTPIDIDIKYRRIKKAAEFHSKPFNLDNLHQLFEGMPINYDPWRQLGEYKGETLFQKDPLNIEQFIYICRQRDIDLRLSKLAEAYFKDYDDYI
jgi:hypothetical protein